MQKVHTALSDRPVTMHSLDVILAVGYRANSAKAIDFRRWATSTLKQCFLAGSAINKQRLEQLGSLA